MSDTITVDIKRSGSNIGVQIGFEYGIEGFDELRDVIKACGGKWNKPISKWVVSGEFAFYCVDVLSSLTGYEVVYSDYFRLFLKNEIKKLERNIISSKATKPISKINIPTNNGLKYFDFQKATVEFFNARGNHILLADDMGLGKTISAIAIANYNKYKKILVICPDSAKEKVWREKLEEWYVGTPDIFVAYSNRVFKPKDIVIINYDIVGKHQDELLKYGFEYLIVDEAHMLKNTSTSRTKAVKKISDKIKNKIYMTGTPILNMPIELFSLLKILMGNTFGDKMSYAKRYCKGKLVSFGNSDKKILYDKGHDNLNELNFKLRSTVMMRRERHDVINEFPNVNRNIHSIDADYGLKSSKDYKKEKERYTDQISALKRNKQSYYDYKDYAKAIKQVQALHFNQVSIIRRELGESKVPDIFKFVSGLLEKGINKIVLFAYHREVIEKLHALFGAQSIILYGGMTPKEKAKIVTQFEEDPNIKIFIGSIQASGVAYTLTISHTVVFGELDWVPSMIDQCECRCIRLGQNNEVDIYYLIVNGSIDLNMLRKIHKKGKIIKTVMI